MNKNIYLVLVSIWLLISCAEYEFQKGDQNPAPFSKVVSIEDLKILHDKSAGAPFSDALSIQGTVLDSFKDYIYLADNSNYAMRVQVAQGDELAVGDLVRIAVGGLKLDEEDYFLSLRATQPVQKQGTGNASATAATLAEVHASVTLFSSKLITIENLRDIQFKETRDGGDYYLFHAGGTEALLFIPASLNYVMPSALVSISGVLRIEGSDLVFSVRSPSDIKEVYVEPMMIEKIMNNSPLIRELIYNNETEVTDGVKFAQFSYTNTDGLLTSGSLFEIDLNNPNVKIEGGSPNNAAPPFTALQTLAQMSDHKNSSYQGTDWKVLAAMTGDFYNSASPFTLNGPLVRNGTILKSDFTSTNDNFLGVLKDRAGFVIGALAEFDQVKNNLEQAVGGRMILKAGEIVATAAIREPRPAIGYTKNNKVYFFVGNGRLLSVSNGYTPLELAQLLKALGCDGAVYLNGGGATVGVMEDASGSYAKFSQSHATNLNHNPSLASSWMIVTRR